MRVRWILVALLLMPTGESIAYDDARTHPALTEVAVDRSVLADPGILSASLGIEAAVDLFPNDDGQWQTVRELIVTGAELEDATPNYLRHFFNPLTGKGLGFGSFTPSPKWALEDEGPPGSPPRYSLRDFRDHLGLALRVDDPSVREEWFGRAFRSIGHTVHHVEDMAQPQHTRDDAHPHFTVDALYEDTTRDRFRNGAAILAVYGPLNDPNTPLAYPIPRFPRARDYWTKAGKGIADYSNAGFVTTETNFFFDGANFVRDPSYPTPEPILPPVVMTVNELATAFPGTPASIISTLNDLGGVFYFFPWGVADELTQQTTPNDFSTTNSVFSADLQSHNSCGPITPCLAFTLNRFNFYTANDLLLPRAIAYSAGLIDHALRGIAHPDGSPVLRVYGERVGSPVGFVRIENTSDENLQNGTLTTPTIAVTTASAQSWPKSTT